MPSCPGSWAQPSRESYFQKRSRSGLTYSGLKPRRRTAISLSSKARNVEMMIRDRSISLPWRCLFVFIPFVMVPCTRCRGGFLVAEEWPTIDRRIEQTAGSQHQEYQAAAAQPVIERWYRGRIQCLPGQDLSVR